MSAPDTGADIWYRYTTFRRVNFGCFIIAYVESIYNMLKK